MTTRANYTFIDAMFEATPPLQYTVYVHCDGYPSGAAKVLRAALKYAWPLPRFEPEEFAASFVYAAVLPYVTPDPELPWVKSTSQRGNVRLTTTADEFDVQWHYTIKCDAGVLHVTAQGGYSGLDPAFEGTFDAFCAWAETYKES